MNERKSISNPEYSVEQEDLSQYTIRLEFLRHDEKEIPTKAGDRIGDETVRLTVGGRVNASLAGKDKNPNIGSALAYGSNRMRTQETALRQMLSDEDEITPDDSLEDIEDKMRRHLPVGRKLIVSDKLDFDWTSNPEFNKVAYDHYLNKKDALLFVYNESDDLARQLSDTTSTTFTRSAGNLAEIVQKYLKILPNWQKTASKGNYGKELQRFCGSHQDVFECFLLKIIEIKEGKQGVLEFLDQLPDKNGFEYSEGYSVVISSKDGKATIGIEYRNKVWQISSEELSGIINSRDEFDRQIEVAN